MNQPNDWEEYFTEKGAALEHARWARWQEYIFDRAIRSGDDNLGIRAFAWRTADVERWERQIKTDYADLSDTEKESDRREVREYLPLVRELVAEAYERGRESARQQIYNDASELLTNPQQEDAKD